MSGPVVGADLISGIGQLRDLKPDEETETSLVVAGLAVQHPCKLSKANSIRVCPHQDHARDAGWLRTALLVLGLIEDPDARGTDDLGRPIKTKKAAAS